MMTLKRSAIVGAFLVLPLWAQAQQVLPNAGEAAPPILPPDLPPSTVVTLEVDYVDSPPSASTITLTWRAPSDTQAPYDLLLSAKAYDLRWSTAGPIDETNWDSATPAPEAADLTPLRPNQQESLTVTLPLDDTDYWFALKSQDGITSQWSEVSAPSPMGATLPLPAPPSPSPSSSSSSGNGSGGGCGAADRHGVNAGLVLAALALAIRSRTHAAGARFADPT